MGYTLFGKPFRWLPPFGPSWKAKPEDKAAAVRFYTLLPDYLDVLKPIPTEVVPGGFDGIQTGLDKLKSGGVSGKKLIVELQSEL